eukprot:423978_1
MNKPSSNKTYPVWAKGKFINHKTNLLVVGYCRSIESAITQHILNIILLYYYVNKTINKRINLEIAYDIIDSIDPNPIHSILNVSKDEYNKWFTKYFVVEDQKYEIDFNPIMKNMSLKKNVEAILIIFDITKAQNSLNTIQSYFIKWKNIINVPIILIASNTVEVL